MQASLHYAALAPNLRSIGAAHPLQRLLGLVRRIHLRIAAALRPVDLAEAYLAQAQNHADLERRMLELQYTRDLRSNWY